MSTDFDLPVRRGIRGCRRRRCRAAGPHRLITPGLRGQSTPGEECIERRHRPFLSAARKLSPMPQERLEDTFAQAQAEVDAERNGQGEVLQMVTLVTLMQPGASQATGELPRQFTDQSSTETANQIKDTVDELKPPRSAG